MNVEKIFGIIAVVSLVGIIIVAAFSYTILLEVDELRKDVAATNVMLDLMAQEPHMASYLEEYEAYGEVLLNAIEEGKLMLYCGQVTEQALRYLEAFKEKYPFIEYEFYRTTSLKLYEKFTIEAEHGVFLPDAIVIGTPQMADLSKAGYLLSYQSPEHEHYADQYVGPGFNYTITTVRATAPMVNTEIIPEEFWPTDWTDFINPRPEWIGEMAFQDPRINIVAYHWIYGLLKTYGESTVRDIMQGLKAAGTEIATSTTALSESIYSGEYGMGVNHGVNEWLEGIQAGYPVEVVWNMSSGLSFFSQGAAILRTAPHPNVAILFYEFLLSPEGQDIVSEYNAQPTRQDVPSPEGLPDLADLKLMFTDELAAYATEYRELIVSIFETYFG